MKKKAFEEVFADRIPDSAWVELEALVRKLEKSFGRKVRGFRLTVVGSQRAGKSWAVSLSCNCKQGESPHDYPPPERMRCRDVLRHKKGGWRL